MMSIGEFARYAGVSVRMLRHYDQLGLLVPAAVDPYTGYRYYAAAQLPRLNRLIALKDLGFTLQQIGPILDAEVEIAELRGMLALRRAQIADQIEADRARLEAIEQRLHTIEGETQMSDLEFVRKSVPAVRVVQLTTTVADTSEISAWMTPAYQRLAGLLARHGVVPTGPAISWYEGRGDGLLVAAAMPTSLTELRDADGAELADLEAVARVESVIHRGSMGTVGDSWQALVQYAESVSNGLTGRPREVYLDTPLDRPDEWVTELQQPVLD